MMTATLIHLMLFPQLYILVGSTNKKLTLVLQLVFIVPMMTLTTPHPTVHTVLRRKAQMGLSVK
jgi:hypothetical protein